MIELFGMRCCPLDLITDEKTNRLSATKLWLHVGHTILSYAMLKHVAQHALTFDIIIAYGGIVAGHHGLVLFLKKKYGMQNESPDNSEPAQR
jgi:hypothetical protein